MSAYQALEPQLVQRPSRWLVTGAAGLIGSHLVERLLTLGQRVVELPKVEDLIGKPLSPYAVTMYVNELYADVFSRTYGMDSIGLRYFNVFGPRKDPQGAYAYRRSGTGGHQRVVFGDSETRVYRGWKRWTQ